MFTLPPPNVRVAYWIMRWITWTLREEERRRNRPQDPPEPAPMPPPQDLSDLQAYYGQLVAAGMPQV